MVLRWLSMMLLALTLSSCGIDTLYCSDQELDEQGWMRDSWVCFDFQTSSQGWHNASMSVFVGYTSVMAYPNLELEIKSCDKQQKIFWSDTLSINLRGVDGRWRGRTFMGRYDLMELYRTGVNFRPKADYSVAIRQLTARDTLHGVCFIGIEIK
ncbi:MAG: hypothetical protein RR931_01340 [Mucinivorans sp.]